MRQSISRFRFLSGWTRRIIGLVVCLYFVLGLALLGLRYVILPDVDHWRPEIQTWISKALGTPIELGRIHASWHGWNPMLELDDVVLRNPQGAVLLSIPETRARLSWRSVLRLRPGLRLSVRGMDLAVRRDTQGGIHVLGQRIQGQESDDEDGSPWLAWLVTQPSIALQDTTIRWHDEWRAAPELVFTGVEAILDGSVRGVLSASFSMHPPEDMGGTAQVRARIKEPERLAHGAWPRAYRSYVAIEDLQAAAWRPWANVPKPLRDGRLTLRVWAEAGDEQAAAANDPRVTFEAAIDGMDWVQAPNIRFQAPRVRAYAQGPWTSWRTVMGGASGAGGPLRMAVQTQGLDLRDPEWFQHPIALGRLDAEAQVRVGEPLSVTFDQLHWRNPDIDVSAAGSWRAGEGAGEIDLEGTIARARLDAIHRYLPLVVNADARDWLAHGLRAGTLTDARLSLRGDPARFPFGDHPEAGDFLVAGAYHGAVIDYAQAEPGKPAWPALLDLDGTAELHRVALTLTGNRARILPADGTAIDLANLHAVIPNIERNAVLTVSGQTRARGEDYMALLAHSPLGGLLDGVFDHARAAGAWAVPLTLTVPLLHSVDTQVDGRIVFDHGTLRLMPQVPAFEHLEGALHFTEKSIGIESGFTLRVLDGAASLAGRLGGDGQGLILRGRMTAEALAGLVDLPGMSRVTGALDYEGRLTRGGRGYQLALDSDLRGLELNFPAPLAKPDTQARTLRIVWSNQEARDDTLAIDLGTALSARLRHRRGTSSGPYFQAASIGVNRAAPPPDGLAVDIAYPLLDMDVWNDIVNEFSASDGDARKGAGAVADKVFPALTTFSMQAEEARLLGMRMNDAVLRIVRDPQDDQWSMNVRSEQIAGTLKWRQEGGRITDRVSGRFARLSLGDDPADGPSLLPEVATQEISFDDELNVPAIVLQVDDLRLYGHAVGALSLEGVKDTSAGNWRLETLSLGNRHARIRGQGSWRLRGPQRGLNIGANAEVSDLGAWLDGAGFANMMSGGQGTLKGGFEWRDFPWTQEKTKLGGTLDVQLDKGRFNQLGSRSAKLLELLSLQSITRLSSLDTGLTGLTQEGFPFDQLRGTIELSGGVAHARDYKVIGPVGTILLDGSSSIIDETLNMQAVIVPNLDVSGAAIAAGIAINPVVGIGAFLSQWLLKHPLARAMTVRYRVTGSWDDPIITEIEGGAPAVGDRHDVER
uniref:YhdP family protein n=1 Tax=Castellaniella defragrans TaxID=75697 RepID=UPI00333ECE8C